MLLDSGVSDLSLYPLKNKKAKVRGSWHLFAIQEKSCLGSTGSGRSPSGVLIRGCRQGRLWEREGWAHKEKEGVSCWWESVRGGMSAGVHKLSF